MGFPEPYDWNQNGKVDTEDWIIEEEQRRLSEERRKEQQAKKYDAFPEPPATESETRQGIRACITLGVSAAVFLFFILLDMVYAAIFVTTAVILLLTVFFVLPAGSSND